MPSQPLVDKAERQRQRRAKEIEAAERSGSRLAARVVALAQKEGLSYAAIGRRLNLDRATVRKVLVDGQTSISRAGRFDHAEIRRLFDTGIPKAEIARRLKGELEYRPLGGKRWTVRCRGQGDRHRAAAKPRFQALPGVECEAGRGWYARPRYGKLRTRACKTEIRGHGVFNVTGRRTPGLSTRRYIKGRQCHNGP
jgi:hypothetical protein